MGTFAETAIVLYRLSFAEQEKQTSVSLFIYIDGKQKKDKYIYAVVSNGKWNPMQFALIHLPICAS
jgi:hypothetical protein